MTCTIFKKDKVNLAQLNGFIDHLYNGQQPSIYNLNDAEDLFILKDDDKLIGFATSYYNDHFPDLKFIGNYQCIDSKQAAHTLIEKIKSHQQSDTKALVGPFHGSTWYPYRFSNGVTPSFFMEYIHKDYYLQQWLDNGFEIWHEYRSNMEKYHASHKRLGFEEFFHKRGLSIVNLSEEILPALYEFCTSVFADNVLYSSIEYKSFKDLYLPIIHYIDSTFTDIVMDGDEIVGLFFAILDPHHKHQVIVKTIARNPDDRYKGIATMLSSRFLNKIRDGEISNIIHAYFHIDNKSQNISKAYRGELLKKHYLLRYDIKP